MILSYRGVSYRVPLAVGKEVCSLADMGGGSRHHTTLISVFHVPAEIVLTRARPAGSYCPRVGKIGIKWKHPSLLLVGGMVVYCRSIDVAERAAS